MGLNPIYNDIINRTNGELYLGVVGSVRTGKSTFVRRFIEEFVLDKVDNESRQELLDELPVSGDGTLITTVEPKFIPKNAANISINDSELSMNLRIIDCVGYPVEGAMGDKIDGKPRMIKTPWTDDELPFYEAARLGTDKVIFNHSTMCVVIVTDGSVTDIPRENYEQADDSVIKQVKSSGKPYVIILNTLKPFSREAKELARELSDKYNSSVLPVNIEQLNSDSVDAVFNELLMNFPIEEIEFDIPEYCYMLNDSEYLLDELFQLTKGICCSINNLGDLSKLPIIESDNVDSYSLVDSGVSSGIVKFNINTSDECYYNLISDIIGEEITDQMSYVNVLKRLIDESKGYNIIKQAIEECNDTGYGLLKPDINYVSFGETQVINKAGNYGIKIDAHAPCIHMIRTDINTILEPVIGNEQQANDLLSYFNNSVDKSRLIETNIFGKSLGEMISEEIEGKISLFDDNVRNKLKDSIAKIVNESTSLVCFII